MDVNIRLLRYFAAVAQEGTLTGAAAQLYVSQPALTKQIQHLEAQLDVELFVRSHTGVTLTDAGRVLAERLPTLLAEWDTAVTDARRAAAHAGRVLRIGFVATAA
ncbi:MAG: LysR family transcriptional regulator, partial [Nocardiaceae bacterium]|nr:LysR family transcriptional regulator [Nocardiaceae bacterium]